MSTSYSHSTPVYKPLPYDPSPVIDFPGFDLYGSMSMSAPVYTPTLPEDVGVWWDIDASYSYSMPASDTVSEIFVADAGTATDMGTMETKTDSSSGEAGAVGGDGTDTTAAKNFGADTGSSGRRFVESHVAVRPRT